MSIEQGLIAKLEDLKYLYRPDIRDRSALEQNFRAKFEALNLRGKTIGKLAIWMTLRKRFW